MSVLLAREEEAKRAEEKAAAANSPLLYNHKLVNGDKISKVRVLLFYRYMNNSYTPTNNLESGNYCVTWQLFKS